MVATRVLRSDKFIFDDTGEQVGLELNPDDPEIPAYLSVVNLQNDEEIYGMYINTDALVEFARWILSKRG